MDKRYLLLDLDGTVTDSSLGIINSALYALKQYGIEEDDRKKLEAFIGPPLNESFMKFYGFPLEQSFEAVEKYREYYRVTGIFENRVYDGIREFLSAAKAAGKVVILATSKPEIFARQILEHFDLMRYFDFCVGSELDGRRVKKDEVIAYAMEQAGITDVSQAIMIGDREHDIIGAHKCGMQAIGVLFGFGDLAEMRACQADYVVDTPQELAELLGL